MADTRALWLARCIVRQAWQQLKDIRTSDPSVEDLLADLNQHCIDLTNVIEAEQGVLSLPVLVKFPEHV